MTPQPLMQAIGQSDLILLSGWGGLLLGVEGAPGEGDVVIGREEGDQAEREATNGLDQSLPVNTQGGEPLLVGRIGFDSDGPGGSSPPGGSGIRGGAGGTGWKAAGRCRPQAICATGFLVLSHGVRGETSEPCPASPRARTGRRLRWLLGAATVLSTHAWLLEGWGAGAKKKPPPEAGAMGAMDQVIQRSGGATSLDAAAQLAAEAESGTSTQDRQGAWSLRVGIGDFINANSRARNRIGINNV